MYPYSSDKAAHQARKLLRTASRVLGTVDPSGPVTGLLDGALPLPPGDPRYRSRHAFEPRFSETLELGFHVEGFWTAVLGGIVVSIATMVIDAILPEPR